MRTSSNSIFVLINAVNGQVCEQGAVRHTQWIGRDTQLCNLVNSQVCEQGIARNVDKEQYFSFLYLICFTSPQSVVKLGTQRKKKADSAV